MNENLEWETGYNVVAIPVAAGMLVPLGIVLSPDVAGLPVKSLVDYGTVLSLSIISSADKTIANPFLRVFSSASWRVGSSVEVTSLPTTTLNPLS
jgi:hypothetical protein